MSSRPRRTRKAARPPLTVNNAHYVGYVEDNESVEAIMKKFEELARIEEEFKARQQQQKAASAETKQGDGDNGAQQQQQDGDASTANDAALAKKLAAEEAQQDQSQPFTDEQLQEVFKRTSVFTVRSMLRDTPEDVFEEEEWQANIADEDYLYDFEEEDDYLIAMDDSFWDEEMGITKRKRGRRGEPRPPKEPKVKGEGRRRGMGTDRETILQRYKVMQVTLQDRNGNYYTVKKKISNIDPSLPTYVRIPPVPIPRSWIKPILRFQPEPEHVPGSRYEETSNILELDLTKYGTDFQVIYMDPPLLREGEEPGPNKITMAQLATLNVGAILPKGFLFVWVEKEFLPDMVALAEQWECRYVENFCWIKCNVNNEIVRTPSRLFNSSKLTCLIFRKEGEVELRHQRSPDCIFDFMKPTDPDELSEEKPKFIYELIETLLPQAVYSESNSNGDKMIELWARRGTRRKGWTSICQTKVV
ncbi:hypothetical protein BGW41_007828 [Actinomortierella wolfii]|nr:hypothetical protein BGW41_007828 [Actinomortierella wolfii]